MKINKSTLFVLLAILLGNGCTKIDDSINIDKTPVTIKEGIVVFDKIEDYLHIAENIDEKQTELSKQLNQGNFSSLKYRTFSANSSTNGVNSISNFTNDFDTTLYTKYLLEILNEDKICMIDSFLIKVDMDNVFCSVIDQKQYSSETSDILENDFSNPHIMVFLDPSEPVLEVLSGLRDNTITWEGYQDSLARKGGQGICLKRGLRNKEDVKLDYYLGNLGNYRPFTTKAGYYRGFIHFELTAEAYCHYAFDPIEMYGSYSWEGVCKGSKQGTYRQSSYNVSPNGSGGSVHYENIKRLYSGGSALRSVSLTTQATAPSNTVGQVASIN